jgi:type II secretory pathway component PulK
VNRRGIALLSTLWLVAALSVVAAGALTLARTERDMAVGRVALTRGRFAAEACLAVLESNLGDRKRLAPIDSLDLGQGTWCRVTMTDVAARLSGEVANAELLAVLVGDPAQSAALLDWIDPDDAPREGGAEGDWYRAQRRRGPRNGPLVDTTELYAIRGFDSAAVARVAPYLTKWTSTRLNVNTASRALLLTLPGLEPGAVDLISDRRARGEEYRDLDGLLASLPSSFRAVAVARYAELAARTRFNPEQLVLQLEGRVPEVAFPVRVTLLVHLLPERFATLAREEW